MASRMPSGNPNFAYGFLRPGQIAQYQVEEFVDSVRNGKVAGQL
jgi:hypothetical protein